MLQVNVKKLDKNAKLPAYATDGAACFDLHSVTTDWLSQGCPRVFKTGLAFEIPKDHVMLVFSRSGHGFKSNVRLSNCVGVIDSDYRGELMIKLTQDQSVPSPFWVNAGDRIAQAMIIPCPSVQLNLVDDLSDTARGTGGLGSTGV